MIFQTATAVSTIIGLLAFFMACLFWYLARVLKFKIDAASQIKDDQIKITVLGKGGYLPANWPSIERKDAIKFAELQQQHKLKVLRTISWISLGALVVLALTAAGMTLISNSSCTSVGSRNAEINCNNIY